MKKTLKFLAMAAIAGIVFTACKTNGGDDGGEPGGGDNNYPPVTITTMPEGEVKAGKSDQIEIIGTGFDTELDYIYVVYNDGEKEVSERVSGSVLTLRNNRVSFGVPLSTTYLDKTIKVYLDRPGYDRMPISKEITFVMPDVAEGYIPDKALRAMLMSTKENPSIAPLFDSYGMLDPVGAGAKIDMIDLAGCTAMSLDGLELFTNTGHIAGWDMASIEVVDLSKFTNNKRVVFVSLDRALALKEIIGGLCIGRIDAWNCPNLEKVDLHRSNWLYNLQIYDLNQTDDMCQKLTLLDIRRLRTGNKKGGREEGPDDYTYCTDKNDYTNIKESAYMRILPICKVLVEYEYLTDKISNTSAEDGPNYNCIYRAWKNGATIEVYDSKDITKKIGDVPAYATNPTALGLPGTANTWVPAGY